MPREGDASLQAALGEVRQAPPSHEAVFTWIQIALAFRSQQHGLAVGGDFAGPSPDNFALTRDGGRNWQLVPGAAEYRSGAAWVNGVVVIAVGPTGSDASFNHGRSWQGFDDGSFDTVDCAHGACWASGEQGRAAYLVQQH